MSYRLGLIGHPVSHSLSPPMHRAALKFFGLEGTYDLLDVDPTQLNERLHQLLGEGFSGFNVTVPHKEAMFALADQHTPQAKRAGATNTIRLERDILVAHNTDIEGFARALEMHFDKSESTGKTALILGSGGASRAALIALERFDFAKVLIMARSIDAANAVVRSIASSCSSVETVPLPTQPLTADVSLIVNTTPLGQKNSELPHWLEHVTVRSNEKSLFFDMVYSRSLESTPLVSYAIERGWLGVDGSDMLVHQACAAFEFWTGQLPPFELLSAALSEAKAE